MIQITNYANVEDVTVIDFGKGSINLAVAVNEKYMSLLMKSKDADKTGATDSNDYKPEVAMIFNNSASVRILIEMLWKVELELTNREMTAVKNVRDIEVVDDSEIKE